MISDLSLYNQILLGLFIFLSGLCIGSFLNVCIYRIPLEKSIVLPASSCPGCGTRLEARDLIPVVSYLFLKGKCRYCKAPISVQYPFVELITGILWVLVYYFFGLSFESLALIFLFSILIAVLFIDMKHMIIPNGLVLSGLAGGAAVFLFHVFVRPFSLYDSSLWYTPLVGMVSASGILFLVALAGLLIYKSDGAMGMGDVKLFMPIGLFLGWKLSMLALFLSILLGGIISVILLLFKIKDRKSAIPFGPFIVLATIISSLWGKEIISWYIGL